MSRWRGNRLRVGRRRGNERGQGLVEFAIVVPVFMMMLLGMLEFGTAFNHQLTLGYATREGARIAADMVNGGGALGCLTGSPNYQSPNAANVDPVIIEAVDRVLSSAGSPIPLSQVTQVRIFKATTTGGDSGSGQNWKYTSTLNTLPDGTKVNFIFDTGNWGACNRSNAINVSTGKVDSVGIAITYAYKGITPIAANLPMSDVTVMQFNPTNTAG